MCWWLYFKFLIWGSQVQILSGSPVIEKARSSLAGPFLCFVCSTPYKQSTSLAMFQPGVKAKNCIQKHRLPNRRGQRDFTASTRYRVSSVGTISQCQFLCFFSHSRARRVERARSSADMSCLAISRCLSANDSPCRAARLNHMWANTIS
jgi:hypothetical protein